MACRQCDGKMWISGRAAVAMNFCSLDSKLWLVKAEGKLAKVFKRMFCLVLISVMTWFWLDRSWRILDSKILSYELQHLSCHAMFRRFLLLRPRCYMCRMRIDPSGTFAERPRLCACCEALSAQKRQQALEMPRYSPVWLYNIICTYYIVLSLKIFDCNGCIPSLILVLDWHR